jgi:signal transduction histidine kinase
MKADEKDGLYYLKPGEADADIALTARERSILDRINGKVAAGESLKAIIDFLFSETRSIMPCDRIGVALLEDESMRLRLYYVVASYEPLYLDAEYSSDISRSSLEAVFSSGMPRLINNLETYYKTHPESESTRLLLKEGVHSNMTCPLTVEGRPVGLLFRSSRRPDAYSVREIRLHLEMAERLSQAVEKAYRIEQLSAAFSAYMEMLGFVTHELKSPLSSIIMLGETLVDGYFGAMEDKPREIVKRIMRKAEYLHSLSDEYLNLSRFETGAMQLKTRPVDFRAEVIDPAVEIVAPQIEANRVEFENSPAGRLGPVECDPDLMKIVVVNLLSNGVKYGTVHGRLRLSAEHREGGLRLSVWNKGPGFPESEKKYLFRKFSRLHTPELANRKGSGIGLYISWKIVALHGGRMWASSEPGQWAEFGCEIPPMSDLKHEQGEHSDEHGDKNHVR